MIAVAAIADDFTGATDLATSLHARGLATTVALGPDGVPDGAEAIGLDAVVVALKTRTAPATEAVADSLAALHALARLDPAQYYVKYCSTFDSTPRGNIGPVLDAVLAELGESRAVVVPSFPDNRRTVYRGRLFVGDDLLEESPMRHHPLTPMLASRVRDLLAPQTTRTVDEVAIETVHAGPASLRDALAASSAAYTVVDAIWNEDLRVIYDAVRDWKVISGGSGLAYGMDAATPADDAAFTAPAGRRLVVCGSLSATTRGQIAGARAAGAAMYQLDTAALATDPDRVVADALAWLAAQPADAVPVVYSAPGGVEAPASAAAVVERANAAITLGAVTTLGVTRVIVAGGETSGAVTQALGCDRLTVGPQISPGVCWTLADGKGAPAVALALKSGNFGPRDMFTTAWELL